MDNPYYEKLIGASLRFVSYRPRSEKEFQNFLTKKLNRWHVAGRGLINKVINRMRELGYIDDAKFAEWWIAQRREFRPKGTHVLRQELLRRGIAKDMVDMLLTGSHTSEFTDAKKLIEKTRSRWQRLSLLDRKKKMWTYLASRGFGAETISRIVDEEDTFAV